MAAMCQRTKLLLNCVGPYRFYGEQVVKVSGRADRQSLGIFLL